MWLKVIIFAVVIYYVIKLIGRIVAPLLFQGYAENINRQMRQQQEEMSRQRKKEKEGDVTVNYRPKSNKNFGKEEGDYIDFEEVK